MANNLSFFEVLFYRIIRLLWRAFKLLLCVFFTAFFIVLLFQLLLLTIPVLGFALLPFSNNYNSIMQGAFNELGFVGNSWSTLEQSLNPFLLCLARIPNATNNLTRFILAFAAIFVKTFNIIAGTTISYPAWWNMRDTLGGMHPLDLQHGAMMFQQELLRIERTRGQIMLNEVRSRGYDSMAEADPHTRLKAMEHASRYVREEYARSFADFIPDFICNLISSVADLFTSVLNLFAPFALDLMSLIMTAIQEGKAGNEGEFILLLVKLIGQEILNQLGLGQCLTNIPDSLIQCLFPTCSQPTITDISALIFACIFQPICTTKNPKNAGDVLFQCMHIQSIVDFGLTVYKAILSLQGVAQSIADFFVGLYNDILSLKSVVDDAWNLIQKLASKFNISLRSVVVYESAFTYLDRIGIALSMKKPYSTKGGEYETLYGLYQFVQSHNDTSAITHDTIHEMRHTFFIGNVTEHKREIPAIAIFNRINDILNRYFSERLIAIQKLHENYVSNIHLPRSDPTVLEDLRAYNALIQDELNERTADFTDEIKFNLPPGVGYVHDGNYTIISSSFLFNNTDLHLSAALMQSLGQWLSLNTSATHNITRVIHQTSKTTTSRWNDQTPIWMAGKTFSERLGMMLNVTESVYNQTNTYQQVRWMHRFFTNETHATKTRSIAHMLDGMAAVVRWGVTTHEKITMPVLHRRMRNIPVESGIIALHALSHAVTLERGTFLTPERNAHMRMSMARWAGIDVFERMTNRTNFRNEQERMASTSEVDDYYHTYLRDIIDERKRIVEEHDTFHLQRMSIIITILGTSIGGTAIWSGVPVSIVASLIPTLASAIVPLFALVTTSLPTVLAYLTQKVSALLTNLFASGEHVAPDLFTNLVMRVGTTVVGMFTMTPSPYIMEAFFSQTIQFAQDVMNDVEMYVLYIIFSFLPPYPFQKALKPTVDDTPSVYFSKLIFTNVDSTCIDHRDCTGGFCRRLVNVHDPSGCAMMCTPNAPCSPPGSCVASPLYIHWNGCIQGTNTSVVFDVDCTQAGFPYTAAYLNTTDFANHHMSFTFLFGTHSGYVFIWNTMKAAFVTLRNFIRLMTQAIMLPVQSLMSGAVSAIPLVPSIFTYVRTVAVVLYVIGRKLQNWSVAAFPVLNWLDQHLWFVNWFGIPSPFLFIADLFRYPNYVDHPPVGKPLPADYMCPVLQIGPVLIGTFMWIVILGIFYALIFGGIFAILFDIFFLCIFPFLYLWYIAKKANTARELNEMGLFDEDVGTPDQVAQISPTWYDSSNGFESIGARIPTSTASKKKKLPRLSPWEAMWPTIRANLTNGDFAARIMVGLPLHDSAHVYHPRVRLPLRNSSSLFIVSRTSS